MEKVIQQHYFLENYPTNFDPVFLYCFLTIFNMFSSQIIMRDIVDLILMDLLQG
jgi:hypothetical protein